MFKFILTLTVVCAVSLGSTFAGSCGSCDKDKKADKTEDSCSKDKQADKTKDSSDKDKKAGN